MARRRARAVQVGGLTDFLWVRVLDVARVLGERGYDHDGELVLEVVDDLDGAPGPAAGRYRLAVRDGAALCERTDADADLTIDIRALSSASLGWHAAVDASRTAAVLGAPTRRDERGRQPAPDRRSPLVLDLVLGPRRGRATL